MTTTAQAMAGTLASIGAPFGVSGDDAGNVKFAFGWLAGAAERLAEDIEANYGSGDGAAVLDAARRAAATLRALHASSAAIGECKRAFAASAGRHARATIHAHRLLAGLVVEYPDCLGDNGGKWMDTVNLIVAADEALVELVAVDRVERQKRAQSGN